MLALGLLAPSGIAAREAPPGSAGQPPGEQRFEPVDVFQLEYAADPQISPDGSRVVYVRRGFDIMHDRGRADLWIVGSDGSAHRPLTSGKASESSPRWSPDGTRLAYVSSDEDGQRQIFVRWMDTGQTAVVTRLTRSPDDLSWSPDGSRLAFTMLVPDAAEPFAEMPSKPEGAEWAEPPRVIDELLYRFDGAGYLEQGHTQIFVVPAEGSTPRQLTRDPYDHGGPLSWTPDGDTIVFSANRREDAAYEPNDTEVYALSVEDGSITQLTERFGPDSSPAVSPDGRWIAYTGYDDRYQGYQVDELYVMDRDGGDPRRLTPDLDRSVGGVAWAADGSGLYFQYDDLGDTKVAFVSLDGEIDDLASDVGGLSIGRPYAGGSFSVAEAGRFAYTHTSPYRPADVAVRRHRGTDPQAGATAAAGAGAAGERDGDAGAAEDPRITRLNEDLFGQVELGRVEEIWYESSFDGRRIQGWLVTPPGFDAAKQYPLVLEIHGGPFANYGDRFSAEVQLFAAAGYVVLYTNPRGSTSYGGEFGNLIHHDYPGEDYDDLMSGVDAVLERGFVDPARLYVTGGSGGGVLTAWIVGHTDRFAAAVVAKPVINWYSFVLTADSYPFFYKYWFPGFPWEHAEHYLERSPIHHVGNVTTPTMLLTGERDHRTPISETEQFYQALKLRKVDTAMVRIPEASHGIAARPSYLIAKVAHILEWFDRHGPEDSP